MPKAVVNVLRWIFKRPTLEMSDCWLGEKGIYFERIIVDMNQQIFRENQQLINKPRILIVGPASPSTGGIPSYIDELFSSQLKDQFLLEIFDPLIVKNRSKKQKSQLNLKEIVAGLKVLKSFIMVMRKYDPAIVHIHTSSYWGFYEKASILLIAKFIFKRGVILHIHGAEFDLFYKRSLLKRLINWLIDQTDRALIVSKEIKERLGLKQVILVDNCVRFDGASLSVNKNNLREKYGIPFGKTVFLSASLFLKKKGIYETLIAFKDIYKERDDFYFIIAGEGPERENIIDLAESNQLRKNVKVMNFITGQEKEDIFLLSDVFILNSTSEALSVAQLETLSHGLFMITTPVGIASNAEDVFSDENCIRVPINDNGALKRAILSVLDKKIDIRSVAEKNFYKFKDRFDVVPVFRKMREIYEEVLSEG